MSKSTINWGILVLVSVAVGSLFWWQGNLDISPVSQSAAVINSTVGAKTTTGATNTPVSASLDQINRDVANMDLQFQAGMSSFANLGSTPSQAKIVAVAGYFKTATLLMTKLSTGLASAITNSKLTALNATLKDMSSQLSNSTSQTGAVLNNTASVSASATTATNATLKQAFTQLGSAQAYLQSARAELTTIVKGLK